MADELSEVRQIAFTWRLKGGARFTPLHRAQIRHHISNLPERTLFEAAEMKLFDEGAVAPGPMAAHVLRTMGSTALSWHYRISDEGTDLPGDQIKVAGWNLAIAARNCPAPLSHDTSALPVGQWSMPYRAPTVATLLTIQNRQRHSCAYAIHGKCRRRRLDRPMLI